MLLVQKLISLQVGSEALIKPYNYKKHAVEQITLVVRKIFLNENLICQFYRPDSQMGVMKCYRPKLLSNNYICCSSSLSIFIMHDTTVDVCYGNYSLSTT
jgi:hypothetical protein